MLVSDEIVGIVGSEEAKFTKLGKQNALHYINNIISRPSVIEVVSGECHLGGIDIWAKEETLRQNKKYTAYPPYGLYWSEFKKRNIEIANKSDIVYCITVDILPDKYTGMQFDLCYHCENNSIIPYPTHVKSGGCWTMYYAIKHGKRGQLIVVHNYDKES